MGKHRRNTLVGLVLLLLAGGLYGLFPRHLSEGVMSSSVSTDGSRVEDKVQAGLDLRTEDELFVTLVPAEISKLAALEAEVLRLGGQVIERAGVKDGVPRLRVRLAGTSVLALAEAEELAWVERYIRPRFVDEVPCEIEPARIRLLNDVAVGEALMNVESVRSLHDLTGAGEVVTTSDSGIDTGDLATMHADLASNLIGFAVSDSLNCYGYDKNGHGTHTAGSIVGTGAMSTNRIRGAAYEAKLWAWFCGGKDGYVYTPTAYSDIFRPEALGPTNAYVHSASWGGDTNVYSSESQAIDKYCWEHPDFLPVFAAGNDGKHGAGTICEQGGAKNALCVGATESYRTNKDGNADNPDDLAYFSSRGPMPDGRIKPDLCAPGTYIVSTRSSKSTGTGWGVYNEYYLYNGGTSMATPLMAGAATLVRQWLVRDCGYTNTPPSSALLKAILTGGATRLGTVPANGEFGWGRVNLAETLFPTNGLGIAVQDRIPFAQDSVRSFAVMTTNTAPLDVQLCWIDYPATPMAAKTKSLVIDLDLVVSNETTGVVYTPDDHTNNLESVRLDLAEPGRYIISVRGTDTAGYNSNQGGAAAVYVRGAFENQAVDTNEYVTVVVKAEGGGDQNCVPAVGTYRYVKGETVTFTAGKYADDGDGTDYRYSSDWRLDLEKYPLICWRAEGAGVRGGFDPSVTLTVTNDMMLTWWWRDLPSHVGLWLESYDDFYEVQLYPGNQYGAGYWMPYGEEVTLTAEDAPIRNYYNTSDKGLTVPVNGWIYTSETDWFGYKRRFFGTLRFTSFCLLDEEGAYTYSWDSDNRRRLPDSITLPMTSFTAVDFGYADETDRNTAVGLPYWWWARNFQGAYENGDLSAADTYATGDPDGDGFANLAEYEEPTDPWNADDFPFRFTEVTSTNLTFIGTTNGEISVQHVEHLGDTWTNLWTDAAARPTVTNVIDYTRGPSPSGFYRLHHTR